MVEEHDATDGEGDGEDGGEAYSFFEKYAHNHGHHDGIDEEDGACDACLHVEKARVEGDGGYGKQHAEKGEDGEFATRDGEGFAFGEHHDDKADDGKGVAIEEYATDGEAVLVEI